MKQRKQITVIAASNAESFQRLANKALTKIDAQRLVFDNSRPYTLYIIHNGKGKQQHGNI